MRQADLARHLGLTQAAIWQRLQRCLKAEKARQPIPTYPNSPVTILPWPPVHRAPWYWERSKAATWLAAERELWGETDERHAIMPAFDVSARVRLDPDVRDRLKLYAEPTRAAVGAALGREIRVNDILRYLLDLPTVQKGS